MCCRLRSGPPGCPHCQSAQVCRLQPPCVVENHKKQKNDFCQTITDIMIHFLRCVAGNWLSSSRHDGCVGPRFCADRERGQQDGPDLNLLLLCLEPAFFKSSKDRVFRPIFKCSFIGSHSWNVVISLCEPMMDHLKVGQKTRDLAVLKKS